MSSRYLPVKHNAQWWNHWSAFYKYCDSYKSGQAYCDEMNLIARKLRKFNGTIVYNTVNPPGIIGLEFNTDEDLLIFKLTFN